jgi:hypothetical protein
MLVSRDPCLRATATYFPQPSGDRFWGDRRRIRLGGRPVTSGFGWIRRRIYFETAFAYIRGSIRLYQSHSAESDHLHLLETPRPSSHSH